MDTSQHKAHNDDHNKAEIPAGVPARAEKIGAGSAPSVEGDEQEELEEFGEGGSFTSNLAAILRSLNPGRHVFGCLFALLFVGGVVYALFFGGWSVVRPYIPFLSQAETAPSFSSEKVNLNVHDTRTAFRFGFYKNNPSRYDPPSLEIAYIFGGIRRSLFFPIPPGQSGIAASYSFGFRGQSLDRFERYVNNILQVQNILNTDVAALLNVQTNRKLALDNLIESFDNLMKVTTENADFVTKEVVTMRAKDTELRAKLLAQEKLFTASLSKFLPNESKQQLDEYLVLAKEQSEVKAQLGAMAKIDKYYQVAAVKLQARIRDIKANQDALVKGVTVFDIKNSDLNIIEYEGKPPADPAINAIDRSKSGSPSGSPLAPLNMFPNP